MNNLKISKKPRTYIPETLTIDWISLEPLFNELLSRNISSVSELEKWLPSSRWKSEQGELQFYADHTVFGYPFEGTPKWEALAGNRVRITWSDKRKVEYLFDYTWSSFHDGDDPKAVFKLVN